MIKKKLYNTYIWGDVGRGKTWLMDLFYQSLPTNRKMRIHFHEFMLKVHNNMHLLEGKADPLKIIAKKFKNNIEIICFDEFFIADIADAMLLGKLVKYFLKLKITLIITSNTAPRDLYKNGLQRAQFLSTIALIHKNYTILNLDSGLDYRLLDTNNSKFWLYPINKKNKDKMEKFLFKFSTMQSDLVKKNVIFKINNRDIKALWVLDKISAFNFSELCVSTCNQNDYISISKQFSIIFLYDVFQINKNQEDIGKRFLFLIDALYTMRVKLIVMASVCISKIYQGELLKFEYKRCISRLNEMQSEKYFLLKHFIL
ncbi:MAG: putative nucleoside triphosphate hydrolase [Wigglesworthia glossinidia]|nr:putative nucleoside triphosphate hydrolase [Wigglesworthia glossinidia]